MRNVQKQVENWVKDYKVGYFKPLEIMAREINHRFGPKKKKETEDIKDMEEEVADIIFTLACLSNSLGLNMERGFDAVMKKVGSRDKNRWEKK